jgi:hypothetical protein
MKLRMRGASRARVLAVALVLAGGCAARSGAPFEIAVVDADTGRGIPAVELRTTDARTFHTDSSGKLLVRDADLAGRTIFFAVRSFGYRYAREILGRPGVRLRIEPGGEARLDMQRENVAQRLYRLTGSGISLGTPALSISEPPDAAIAGLDSAQAVAYRGELFWIFGDARILASPVGSFRSHAARSELPGRGGLEPDVGVALRFYRDGPALRQMVDDPHPILWLTALRATRGADGEHLFATYQKIGEGMSVIERGLVELDPAREKFRIAARYPADAAVIPEGVVFRHAAGGRTYLHYDMDVRSPDDAASVRDLATYEAFTPLRPGRPSDASDALERDASGELVWGWKRAAAPLSRETWQALLARGSIRERELPYRLLDVESGATVVPHRGSIHWNAHRRRWIMIRSELGGAQSFLGEVYYFEANSPLGPWAYGRKIVTHSMPALAPDGSVLAERETYSFYNPVHHPELDRDGGRTIYFEGTLSAAFTSPRAHPIPGYDYNPIMYRLDLDDPRLYLPVAIYRMPGASGAYRTLDALPADVSGAELAFFAPDRPRAGTVELREISAEASASHRLVAGGAEGVVRFHCARDAGDSAATLALYERRTAAGDTTYDAGTPRRGDRVLCYVWPKPVDFPKPLRRPPAQTVER